MIEGKHRVNTVRSGTRTYERTHQTSNLVVRLVHIPKNSDPAAVRCNFAVNDRMTIAIAHTRVQAHTRVSTLEFRQYYTIILMAVMRRRAGPGETRDGGERERAAVLHTRSAGRHLHTSKALARLTRDGA